MRALVRPVSPRIADCELMDQGRVPIDAARAQRQHQAYVEALESLGVEVARMEPLPERPDGVFVEDTAVVTPEVAVITRPGAASRQPEVASTAAALAALRPLAHILAPGTLDGGDVLRMGRDIYVGLSRRTNRAGFDQLAAHLAPCGYRLHAIPLINCLHLKSAVTGLDGESVLLNPAWIESEPFARHRQIRIDPAEPGAANALSLAGTVLASASHPRTIERIAAAGYRVRALEVSELHKAEAGLTCMSIILDGTAGSG